MNSLPRVTILPIPPDLSWVFVTQWDQPPVGPEEIIVYVRPYFTKEQTGSEARWHIIVTEGI